MLRQEPTQLFINRLSRAPLTLLIPGELVRKCLLGGAPFSGAVGLGWGWERSRGWVGAAKLNLAAGQYRVFGTSATLCMLYTAINLRSFECSRGYDVEYAVDVTCIRYLLIHFYGRRTHGARGVKREN